MVNMYIMLVMVMVVNEILWDRSKTISKNNIFPSSGQEKETSKK